MRCPYCGSEDTRVSDSRPVEENNSIRRRRVCDACKRRFTTYEKIETIPVFVVKKDQNREPYDRAKIEAGVLRACHKRPVSAAEGAHGTAREDTQGIINGTDPLRGLV